MGNEALCLLERILIMNGEINDVKLKKAIKINDCYDSYELHKCYGHQ